MSTKYFELVRIFARLHFFFLIVEYNLNRKKKN